MNLFLKGIRSGLRSLSIFLEYGRIRKKIIRFKERAPMSAEQIFSTYYLNVLSDREKFLWVWRKIGEVIKVDPDRIRPDDRFDGILSPVKGREINDELEEIDDFFSQEASLLGIDYYSNKIETVDDLVRLFVS